MFLILTPFALADAALSALGYGEALDAFAVVVAVIPGSYVLEILWAAYIAPIQVKGDDLMMPAQFNLRQLLTGLPLVVVFVFVSVATIFPAVAVTGGLVLIALSAVLTMNGKFWNGVVAKLTENGFV